MAFPPSFLDELRARLSLAQIIGRRVRLTRKGHEHTGLCPFHNEKTPSFTVSEDKGFYHCFGCGAHGSVFDFVMNTENLSFPEAVEKLAEEAGMEVPRPDPETRAQARRQADLAQVMELACAFYESQLRAPMGRAAAEYLRGRGVDGETAARFRLGFAPPGGALKGHLLRQGIAEEDMAALGLVVRPDDGRPAYDYFRDRVLFPITDSRGRVIAFGGRTMGDGQPKYLNSPETPLFNKGRVLYGLAQARARARQERSVIVAEGYMDVIALARAGFSHAVAPLGTAVTEAQLELLWRLAPEPVLCLDGDAAGQRAALRAAERALPLLAPERSLRFALLPPGSDPDDLIAKEGAGAMQAVLEAAEPMADALWRSLSGGRALDTPERRAQMERDVEQCVRRIADRMVQEHYRRDFRDRLWSLLRRDRQDGPGRGPGRGSGRGGGRANGAARPTPVSGRPPPPRPRSAQDLRERILLATLINHPDLFEDTGEALGMLKIRDIALDKLRQEALITLAGSQSRDSRALARHLSEGGFAKEVDSLLSPKVYVHAWFARPDAPLEAAREGWDHTFALCRREELESDIRSAGERLATDMTDEAFGRFQALKVREGQAPANGVSDAPEPPGPDGGFPSSGARRR